MQYAFALGKHRARSPLPVGRYYTLVRNTTNKPSRGRRAESHLNAIIKRALLSVLAVVAVLFLLILWAAIQQRRR